MSTSPHLISLAELEDNLKNIDSTQKQVKNLVSSMDDLARSYQETLTKVDKVGNNMNTDIISYNEGFSRATKQFAVNLDEFETELNKRTSQFKVNYDEFIKSQKSLFDDNKTSWDGHTKEFKTTIESFRKNLNSESKDIVAYASNRLDNLNELFSDQVRHFSKTVGEKIEELNSVKTNKVLEQLSEKVDALESEVSLLRDQIKSNHEFLQLVQKSHNEHSKELRIEINKKGTVNSILICAAACVIVLAVYLMNK